MINLRQAAIQLTLVPPAATSRRHDFNSGEPMCKKTYLPKSIVTLLLCSLSHFTASLVAQTAPKGAPWRPPELQAVDPEIRGLLDQTSSTCERSDPNEVVERVQKAVRLADVRGLIRDRALAEAVLGSAYIGQAKIAS